MISTETAERIDTVFAKAQSDSRSVLFEFEVYQILEAIGLPVPRFTFIRSIGEVDEERLKPFGRTIVIKIVSSAIAHKQRVGGVKVIRNLDPLFVQFALTRMGEEVCTHFNSESQPEIEGYLIVEYIPHTQALGFEVLIGFKEDAAFGPVMTISKGGDDAEFFAKFFDPANLYLTPLSETNALKLFNSLHIKQKFAEIGRLQYLQNMADATATLSRLAHHYSRIAEGKPNYLMNAFDINPFVITEEPFCSD